MADVFLSYSRADADTMRRLRDHLQASGLTVWNDESLEPGTPDWEAAIEREIRNANSLVLVLSPDAAASRWVRAEIALAGTFDVPVFPFWVRGTEQEVAVLGLVRTQRIDARTDFDDAARQLAAALHDHLDVGQSPDTPTPPSPPASPTRRICIRRLSAENVIPWPRRPS